jgi:trans-aconitate 2-methyltransferase
VYCHWLDSADAAVEWVKGTLLTAYQAKLPPAAYTEFLSEYTRRVRAALGDARPLFYPFKRILVHAVRPVS